MATTESSSHHVYVGSVVVKIIDADGHSRLDREIPLEAAHLACDLRAALDHPGARAPRLLTACADSRNSSTGATGGATPGDASSGSRRVPAQVRTPTMETVHTVRP